MLYKKYFLSKKLELIAGVDEVGCGSLVGPVIAAAVILHPERLINGLVDSKKLNTKNRFNLYKIIVQNAMFWSLGYVSALEIDCINILQARFLAMRRAIYNLSITPDLILVDGNCSPNFSNIHSQFFKKGDTYISMISAASIIAKVTRDQNMYLLDVQYPEYGFSKNKGYPTVFHLKQLKLYGPTFYHRKSFAPVKFII